MTSRPNLGGPQRSSSANIVQSQRPAPNRTLSHQFPPSSPARRNQEGLVDLSSDGTDAAPGRYGTIPRNGGSRLKLEISKEAKNPILIESPKPTSVATPTWRPSVPPRGRPQLHFDVPSVSHLSPHMAQDGVEIDAIKSMPLPVRPGQYVPPPREKVRIASGSSGKKEARPKPYVLEVPTAAPHYSPNGHADFFPWTGNHLEDQFSETAIRQGFYDKSQMTQNETGSAKPSLFPALKHKSGLQTLSSLFTSVLTQRRAHGQITSNSTFKPPPRVTVTDTKREIWLKDLANPTISLRRLSRSIPHGIRGKVLLDQSLSKNIPVERAVWLAKCVGANELRAFRRKGISGTFAMGGEAKWIRDFTVCVEQFIESIVGSCGEKEFRSRINYAIRLAATFYAEHLLDREHYMDWLVSAMENTPQAKLPMWILITQVYWKDLLLYRKYARRLCFALINQLSETLDHPDIDVLAPLANRLKTLLNGLVASRPDSFVYPKGWAKHRAILQSALTPDDGHSASMFASIDRRNNRMDITGPKRRPSPKRLLIDKLDATLSTPLNASMVKECWQITDEKNILIQTVIEWSTSAYRPGTAKIYVAARMLRQWSRFGADITEAILTFLDTSATKHGRNKPAFYHLVSELARSEHFSTSVYLQWIIARGGLEDISDVAQTGPCATRLLAELPTHNLSDSISTLRTTLLNRIGLSMDEEDALLETTRIAFSNSLPGMQDMENSEADIMHNAEGITAESILHLSRTNKSELGLWLRELVGLQMRQPNIPPLDDWDNSPMKEGTSAVTASQFITVRHHLEALEDYSILADVLKIVASSNDAEVLASCADTLSLHFDIFAAIGALNSLFEILMTRLRSLNEDDVFPRVLLVALSDAASRIPEEQLVAKQLSQELARSDRKTAADACSPVSDHMAGTMQVAEADFTDEIEKVLASGNSMDQATLERLFQRIALRLEESWGKSTEQHRSCSLLFTRLRTFDAQQFDILVATWVKHFLQMGSRPSIIQVLGPLISLGCLALPDVVSSFKPDSSNGTSTPNEYSSRVLEEMLALCLSPFDLRETLTAEDSYRLRIKQNNLQRDHSSDLLMLMRRALDEPKISSPLTSELLTSPGMIEMMRRYIIIDADLTINTLVAPLLQGSQSHAKSIITSMVDILMDSDQSHDKKSHIPVEDVLEFADDYTLPFCQVKLSSMLSMDSATNNSEERRSDSMQAFDSAIASAVSTDNTTWTCILPFLDTSIARHLHARAVAQFLALLPTPKTVGDETWTSAISIRQCETLLYIIDATAFSMIPPLPNNSLVADIPVALHNIWIILSSSTSLSSPQKDLILTKSLPLLLSLTTIHATIFEATKAGNEGRARSVVALAAIVLELQALETSSHVITSLIEQTFDIALQLVDLLPDDVRQQCIRALRDTASSPRLSYLLSISPSPTDWLYLSQKEKPTSLPGPEGRSAAEGKEKLSHYSLRVWEMLGEPTPNVGENDTSLSLTLFSARRG